MAIGEYSSVSSQRDAERADLETEAEELRTLPRAELAELTGIYERRGLPPDLAREVAEALTEHDALAAHARLPGCRSGRNDAGPLPLRPAGEGGSFLAAESRSHS